jgi:hypothetical protein
METIIIYVIEVGTLTEEGNDYFAIQYWALKKGTIISRLVIGPLKWPTIISRFVTGL